MAYDLAFAARIERLVEKGFPGVTGLERRKMFGGIGYLLNGNMCFGLHKQNLLIRVGVDVAAQILEERHVRPMDLTGRVMKGWATVEPEAVTKDDDLRRFCALAISFVQKLPPKKPAPA